MSNQLVFYLVYAMCLVPIALCSECPTGCTCKDQRVDCTNVKLEKVPENPPANITLLNLVGSGLERFDQSTFVNFDKVEQLCLAKNNIVKIDSDIFKSLSSLRRLDLSNNQISSISKKAFDKNVELAGLDLSNNYITEINGIFNKNPKLTDLNLAANKITEIKENDFQHLTKLKYLDLSSNQITTLHPKAFEPLKEIRYLVLQSNKITSLGVLSFTSKTLMVTDFTNNELQRVPRGLPKSITDLRIGRNNITSIRRGDLKHISSLQLLTLNNNQISNIHDSTFNGLDNMKEMWLNSNRLTTLPKKLPKNLVKLALNLNMFSKIERNTFDKNHHLEDITIEMNKIEEIAAEAFSKLPSLKHLNLQGNQIRILTPRIFKDMKKLINLKLANNPIATIRAKAFVNLESLKVLDMSYSELEDVKIHMDILREMPKLEELNLMNSAGLAKSLLDQIKEGEVEPANSVKKVDLQYNSLLYLPTEMPNTFPNVTTLLLNDNAWHCDSTLLWLKEWLATQTIKFYDTKKPACCTPRVLRGKPMTEVPDVDYISTPADEEEGNENTETKKDDELTVANGDEVPKTDLSLVEMETKSPQKNKSSERRARRKNRRNKKRNKKNKRRSKEERRKRTASKKHF